MREIEFRGKSEDEWVYGMLLKTEDDDYGEHGKEHFNYLIQTEENKEFERNQYYITNDSTIGQYTGLKDKNGNKIYEGDIIEFSYDAFVGNFDTFIAKGKIVFIDGAFYIECFDNKGKTIDEIYLLYSINLDDIEKVGNIYDNPELLKGE